MALRWCADVAGVSTVIPGARNPGQARANAGVGDRPPLPPEVGAEIAAVYDEEVKSYVEDRW